MAESQEHEIDQIIDNLKSNLFYHGHPINRKEAKIDLKLKVADAPDELAAIMWDLYVEYETALKIKEPFQPLHELDAQAPVPAGAPLTAQQIMQTIGQMGVPLGAIPEKQLVDLAVAMLPHLSAGGQAQSKKLKLQKIAGAYVESSDHADIFLTDITLERATINTPVGPQEGLKQEVIWQRWDTEK